jgi:hypothetical protein
VRSFACSYISVFASTYLCEKHFLKQNTVTYSGVLFTMELYCTPKVNTLQLNIATLRTHVHVQPARSRNIHSYRILPTGPLVAIFQHSLPFLQSESFQTHIGTIHRLAIDPLAHHNGTSAYTSLTCTSPDDRMSSSSTVLTHVLLSQLHEKSVDNSLVSMELNYSLVTLLSAWLHS